MRKVVLLYNPIAGKNRERRRADVEAAAEVLRASGHEVACCSSGAEALQSLQTESFDCIVTDLRMPGMTGSVPLAAAAASGRISRPCRIASATSRSRASASKGFSM